MHTRHLFDFKQIWRIQSRLASDYALQGDTVEAEKWFQRSIDTIDAAAKTHEASGTWHFLARQYPSL